MKCKEEFIDKIIDELISKDYCPDEIMPEINIGDCDQIREEKCDCFECWKSYLKEE